MLFELFLTWLSFCWEVAGLGSGDGGELIVVWFVAKLASWLVVDG